MLEALAIVAVVIAVQLYQSRGLPEGAAPPLAGPRSDGTAFDLGQDYSRGDAAVAAAPAGEPRLVVFWATWCAVCKAEAGNIERIARHWPVVGVATQSGSVAEVAAWLKAREADRPAVVDVDGRIATDWRIAGVPTHFVLDGRGNVRFRVVGYATTPGLAARLWWAGRFLSP